MLPKHGEPITDAQKQAVAARERCKSEPGICAHKRRIADAEGVIGELKNQHALDRVRSRGTPLFHVQLLLGCTALNCKRLAEHVPQAASGTAGAPAAAARDLPSARSLANTPDQATRGASTHTAASLLTAQPSSWNYPICLN
jgi:hypothetical protein